MRILVINSGSSSIKFSMFDSSDLQSAAPKSLFVGELSAIGGPEARLEITSPDTNLNSNSSVDAKTIPDGAKLVLDAVCQPGMPSAEAVGYRVVHPGSKLSSHVKIDAEVLRDIEAAVAFAPLHDPAVIGIIQQGMARLPKINHYACFDTVFHQTMPEAATTYALPASYRAQGVRRYGFHGLSCESVVRRLRLEAGSVPRRLIIAHLGSGCSLTAVLDGASIDTTMGLTPTGGVVMGTRPGDLDPGVVLYLMRQQSGSGQEALASLEGLLNHKAGLVALAGLPNDMKAIRAAALLGNPDAALALRVFTRSIKKAIGSLCWALGGLDAIAFAGGIGEHDPLTRSESLEGLQELGVSLEASQNKQNTQGMLTISTSQSKISVLIVPAQEDLIIALHVDEMERSGA